MVKLRLLALSLWGLSAAEVALASLPPVPEPAENPITEEKRVLGKILFWDEQLSSDNSVACGTCHVPSSGGADPRFAIHPGADGVFDTADDVQGSFGVQRRDVTGTPVADPIFGFERQVTSRAAMNLFGAPWAPDLLWDGRAGGVFLDPLDGTTVLIASGGALENQAVETLLSDVEMAKEGRTWADLTSKLETAIPLLQATDLPADLVAALAASPSYGALFDAAFGDPAITPGRIAFAIATYIRTLVPDQAPWDAFDAGDSSALTDSQKSGLTFWNNGRCNRCHEDELFTENTLRNIGLRDPGEDNGQEGITGNPDHRGNFKVPTLRNVGLKATFMHTGDFEDLADVIDFYESTPIHTENLDHEIPVDVPDFREPGLADFLANGLTDPRVADEIFPFDRPTLMPEPGVPAMLVAGALALGALSRARGGD